MSEHYLSTRQPLGLTARILTALGLAPVAKTSLCTTDRMAALDDLATRKALADLPPYLLSDIGIIGHDQPETCVDGQALRHHLW